MKKITPNLNRLTLSIMLSGLMASTAFASPSSAPNRGMPTDGAITEYQQRIEQVRAQQSPKGTYPGWQALPLFEVSTTYDQANTKVKYHDGQRWGVFQNKWWIQGTAPSFTDNSGAWELVAETKENGELLDENESIAIWNSSTVYEAGAKSKLPIDGTMTIFEAKYWTQGDRPILTIANGGTAQEWETPWQKVGTTSEDGNTPTVPDPQPPVEPEPPVDPEPPVVEPEPPVDPEPPVVDPKPPVEPEPEKPVDPAPDLEADGLPAEGYSFLRELTAEHWDWFFPVRSGRFNPEGGSRNMPPYATADGAQDTFTLDAFKRAVTTYNTWAVQNNLKQFLNEGTKSEQALEFASFWAKSSRETSGSWSNAPAPWIVNDKDAGTVWKGALYWIEEMGYTTNPDGTSSSSAYVDYASTAYPPAPGRSYYGRGIIQLSWNYNYGAFSYWLYDNGMMRDLITERDTLLKRPDYVATKGDLSILSGIWFWMTPQGTKPSSHDVIMGNVYNVSQHSHDNGLPPRNDGGFIATAQGESYDEAVISYRLGTVTNIVNGGIECNRANHPGPVQRASYFNAYAKYS